MVPKHWQWAAVEQAGKVLELPTSHWLDQSCVSTWTAHCGRTQERMLEAWHIYQNQPRFSHYQFPLDNWSGLAEGKESVPWLLHSVTLSLEAVNERHLLANGKSPGMTDGDGGQHPPKIGKPCALSLHIKMEAFCP